MIARFLLFVVVSFWMMGAAFASKLPDLNRFGVTQNGNSAKVGAWGSGTWDSAIPIAPSSGGWASAGNYGIPQAAKGPTMSMSGDGKVFFADGLGSYGGVNYPFKATHTVPASTLVDAIAAIAGGPVGIGLFALPFALEWLTSAGGRVDPSNPAALQRTDPTLCTVAPCYAYNNTSIWYSPPMVKRNSSLEACQEMVSYVNANNWGGVAPISMTGSTETTCSVRNTSGSWAPTLGISKSTRPVDVASWIPASMSDISPYMKQTPFDPRVVGEILDKGGDIPFPAPVVTGPSEILGPKTETQNPDGSKTILQPLSRFTFQGDTITNTTNETTVTVVNVDNSIRSVTTTTVTPTPSSETDKVVVADTPFGKVPELYKPKFPNGLTGVWTARKAELTTTPLVSLVGVILPPLPESGGTCPAWPLDLSLASFAEFGSWDVAPPCWIWDFGKVIVIISALLLARRLVFGG